MVNKEPIKILMVEDSITAQELLTSIIEKDPDMKVVKKVTNANDALRYLKTDRPDVLSIDINLPGVGGYDLTKHIMDTDPLPIVIISGNYTKNDVKRSFRAIEVGAITILEKPAGPKDPEFEAKSNEIRWHLKMASLSKAKNYKYQTVVKHQESPPDNFRSGRSLYRCIAIGGSFGGPPALCTIFAKLPKEITVPIFVVQHISPGFTKGMADWLQGCTELKVVLGEDRLKAEAGTVYIAPDRYHMLVDRDNIIHLDSQADKQKIQPSVGRLFRSVAEAHGNRCIGIILTGMGRDGAEELLLMKEKGAATIAQNEESSVIFGMPREAIKLGAAKYVLPLEEIANQVLWLLKN